jgi:transaldolase
MDPTEAKRFLPFKPHNQISNQRLVYKQIVCPENYKLLLRMVKVGKDEGWEVILARMVGRLYPPGFLYII